MLTIQDKIPKTSRSLNMNQFLYKKRHNSPIKAAGLVLTKVVNGQMMFLLQIRRYVNDDHRPRWLRHEEQKEFYDIVEDFGGKVERDDRTPIDIMVREACEESNNMLDGHSLRNRLMSGHARFFYKKDSKYLLAVLPATEEEQQMNGDEFGECEKDEKFVIERTVTWMDQHTVSQRWNELHCRLKMPYAFQHFNEFT